MTVNKKIERMFSGMSQEAIKRGKGGKTEDKLLAALTSQVLKLFTYTQGSVSEPEQCNLSLLALKRGPISCPITKEAVLLTGFAESTVTLHADAASHVH